MSNENVGGSSKLGTISGKMATREIADVREMVGEAEGVRFERRGVAGGGGGAIIACSDGTAAARGGLAKRITAGDESREVV